MKREPASIACLACDSFSTVPAPVSASGNFFATSSIDGNPASVRKVISKIGMPPSIRASATGAASALRCNTMTGITGTALIASSNAMAPGAIFSLIVEIP
jgi:hypothetical protein